MAEETSPGILIKIFPNFSAAKTFQTLSPFPREITQNCDTGACAWRCFLKKSWGCFFNFFMEVLSDFFYWNLIKAGEPAVPHNWSGKAKPLSNTFIIYIFYLYFIIYNWSGRIKQLSNIIFFSLFLRDRALETKNT